MHFAFYWNLLPVFISMNNKINAVRYTWIACVLDVVNKSPNSYYFLNSNPHLLKKEYYIEIILLLIRF